MISDVIDWFKGLFGDTAEQVADGVNDTVDQVGGGAGEALGTLQEAGQGLAGEGYGQAFVEEGLGGVQEDLTQGVTETAQGFQENAFGEVSEATQGFQEQAETLGAIAEDPLGAAADGARDRLAGEG